MSRWIAGGGGGGGGGLTEQEIVDSPVVRAAFGSAVIDQAIQYRTLPDAGVRMAQESPAAFGTITSPGPKPLIVHPDRAHQPILGFGASLTDSAAYCALTYLTAEQRHELLDELFNPTRGGLSTVRVAFGASDFISGGSMEAYWTYDEMPAGETDPTLANFELVGDNKRVIPVLKEILAINPRLRVFASVWVPPVWMKTTGEVEPTGEVNTTSTFNMTYASAYGDYLVKCVQAWEEYGIPIYALSPFNEPFHSSVSWTYLTDADYATLFKAVGAAFKNAHLDTQLLVGDHHWSTYIRVQNVLADDGADALADGVAWHGYSHMPARQSTVRRAYPHQLHHFTEMRTFNYESWARAMNIMAGDLGVGSLRHGASTVTLWNLFLDETGAPFTMNPARQGVVTLPSDGSGPVYNAEFYVLTHLARFVQPGARRIDSSSYADALGESPGTGHDDLESVAFLNPDQSIVLFAYNPTGASITTQVIDARTQLGFPVTLAAGEITTLTWEGSRQPASAPALTPTAPAAPTLTATDSGTGQALLSWTAVPGAQTYIVTRDGELLLMLPASRTSYQDTTSGEHTYAVHAQSVGGHGDPSATQTVTVTGGDVVEEPTGPVNALTVNESRASVDTSGARYVNGTLTRSDTVYRHTESPTSYQGTATVTGGGRFEAMGGVPVTEGQSVELRLWMMNAVGTRSTRASIWWMNSSGGLISAVDGAFTASPTSEWHERTITGVAPAGVATLKWIGQTGSGAINDVTHGTEVRVYIT